MLTGKIERDTNTHSLIRIVEKLQLSADESTSKSKKIYW
jgi:hypothetical protein